MKRFLVLFCVLFLLAAIGVAKEPSVSPAVYNVLSDDDEVAFGRSSAAQLAKDLPMLDDPVIDAYLVTVGGDLAKSSRRANITYHFRVVDSPQIYSFGCPADTSSSRAGCSTSCRARASLPV